MEDVAGPKIRTPSRTGAWMMEAWGAEPVGMPVPALSLALSKGAVDGVLVPFEVFPPLKLQEMTGLSVVSADGSRFGAAVFMFAMNKERYEDVPGDLKAVSDVNPCAAIAGALGAVWDQVEAPGNAMQTESGGSHRGTGRRGQGKF